MMGFAVAWAIMSYEGLGAGDDPVTFLRGHADGGRPLFDALDGDVLPRIDFGRATPGVLEPIALPHGSAEARAKAASASRAEIRGRVMGERPALHVRLAGDFPWSDPWVVIHRTPHDYLPPECDAVRVRARVPEGRFRLCVGSATVYFGCSDVKTAAQEITAVTAQGYRDFEFSLNHGLTRNFRRAGRTKDLPCVQYARWIQEPLCLYAGQGSSGEIAIASISFVSKGEGAPYAAADVPDLRAPVALADFSQNSAGGRCFSASLQDLFAIDGPPPSVLERRGDGRVSAGYEWGRTQILHPPPAVSLETVDGARVLSIRKRFAEEVAFGGLKINGEAEANALEVDLQADPGVSTTPEVVVDVLLLTAAAGSRKFAWNEFVPAAAWREVPELAFTYYLGGKPRARQDFALFHCRRAVAPGVATTLLLPLRDFLCCYGQGDISGRQFREQAPPVGEQMVAIGFLVPFRHRQAPTELQIRMLRARCVQGVLARPTFFQNRLPDGV